ncbi:MAG: hypothetical protein AB7E47_14930 [Desulfovibrionaceae bacterium]
MPYDIAWEPNGVVWTFHGVLTGVETRQANLDIYGDSRFDGLRYQIVDLLHVERFAVTSDALDESAALDEVASFTNPRLVVAVVAAEEEAISIAEMYQSAMKASCWEVQIFPSMGEARDWIYSRS